jgi:hypothetical protein
MSNESIIEGTKSRPYISKESIKSIVDKHKNCYCRAGDIPKRIKCEKVIENEISDIIRSGFTKLVTRKLCSDYRIKSKNDKMEIQSIVDTIADQAIKNPALMDNTDDFGAYLEKASKPEIVKFFDGKTLLAGSAHPARRKREVKKIVSLLQDSGIRNPNIQEVKKAYKEHYSTTYVPKKEDLNELKIIHTDLSDATSAVAKVILSNQNHSLYAAEETEVDKENISLDYLNMALDISVNHMVVMLALLSGDEYSPYLTKNKFTRIKNELRKIIEESRSR